MNPDEEMRLEAALRKIKAAQPPPDFMARLHAAGPPRPSERPANAVGIVTGGAWTGLLRWLVPATALAVGAVVIWRLNLPASRPPLAPKIAANAPTLKADQVQIDRELVSAFDAVGQLPSGEPVRFHCQEWVDKVELRDTTRGLIVQQRVPRLEVLPVNFETY